MHGYRPHSAPGFVGAFRAVVRRPSKQAAASRPCSTPNLRQGCSESRPTSITRPEDPSFVTQLSRPISAPTLQRTDHEKVKRKCEWASLARSEAKIELDRQAAFVQKRFEAAGQEHHDLNVMLAHQAERNRVARRRRDCDRKMMEQISRHDRRAQLEEKQQAKNYSLQVKGMLQSQLVQSKHRRQSEREQQADEDELALRECARLVMEEKAEKALAKEAQQREMAQTSLLLQEQTRLKKIAAGKNLENDKLLLKEYEELMERQDAARAANLQALADDQGRRMALGGAAQEVQLAKDDAMMERIERGLKAKYAADDEKFRRECLERQRRLEECHTQRRCQLEQNQELVRQQQAMDKRHMLDLASQNKKAVADDKAKEVAKQVERKKNQRIVLEQRAQTRACLPIEMTQTERELNVRSLALTFKTR